MTAFAYRMTGDDEMKLIGKFDRAIWLLIYGSFIVLLGIMIVLSVTEPQLMHCPQNEKKQSMPCVIYGIIAVIFSICLIWRKSLDVILQAVIWGRRTLLIAH